MCGVNNVCQSQRNEECQTRDIHTCRESACVCKKLPWIPRILIPIYLICIVTVFSFETILKDHELILSTYNRAAYLNEKYLGEINDSKRVITTPEQKISKSEEERDSLQWATRLIALDKYEHFGDAKRPSTKSNMQITNGSSYDCAVIILYLMIGKISELAIWLITRKANKRNLQAPPVYVLVTDSMYSWMRAIK